MGLTLDKQIEELVQADHRKEKKGQFNFYLGRETHAQFLAICEARGLSASQVIQQFLVGFNEKYGGLAGKGKAKPGR